MKFAFLLFALFILPLQGLAQNDAPARVAARPAKGFLHSYYLYVPPALAADRSRRHTILVLPNNTGKPDDDIAVHEADVKRRMLQAPAVGAMLGTAVLMPAFPRPAAEWKVYTHALDRDSMLAAKPEYRRLDLQLIAMIDDALNRLEKDGLKFDRRILINGFSASGMFANRFTFMHPDRVKAAVIGSPGGWPIAPADEFKKNKLRYPIGIADLKAVAGRKLDLKKLRAVPIFVFLGDGDDNDSVVFGDSYDEEDKQLIFSLLGKTPVERWDAARTMYREAGLNAEFKLYPGVKHTVSPAMREDIAAFFKKHSK